MHRIILLLTILGSCSLLSAQTDGCPSPTEFVLLEKEPTPLNLDSVKQLLGRHPDEIEGKVIFRILLDENGRYVRHLILRTPHPLMTAYYEPIVPLIRWTPAQKAGGKVACWVTLPFQTCSLYR